MDNFQIETAQNVSIHQNVANLGDRILAFFIDSLIIFAYEIIMMIVLSGMNAGKSDQFLYYTILGLPPFLYYLLLETFNNGQTLGKAGMSIRVVKLDGSTPAFSNFLIRWVLRLVDVTLSFGAVALFTLVINDKGQRLGDIAASTTVISERRRTFVNQTLMVEIPEDYVPQYPQVTVFSDNDMQTIKNLFQKAKRESNHRMMINLSEKISGIMQITPVDQPVLFIEKTIKDYNYYTQYS